MITENGFDLALNAVRIMFDDVDIHFGSFRSSAARVTDSARGTADERDGMVASPLKVNQSHQNEQIADM